ncbi:9713_t:CDS:2, partial [Ambispora gerdemannii]
DSVGDDDAREELVGDDATEDSVGDDDAREDLVDNGCGVDFEDITKDSVGDDDARKDLVSDGKVDFDDIEDSVGIEDVVNDDDSREINLVGGGEVDDDIKENLVPATHFGALTSGNCEHDFLIRS